jgi:hypothetical protein
MGVEYDRILEGFDGPFERIEDWNVAPLAGTVTGAQGAAGFLFGHEANDAFTAINRLQTRGHEVYWLTEPVTVGGRTHPAGTFYVSARGDAATRVQGLATDLGIGFAGTPERPRVDALRLRPTRIALADVYGGSMPSGWTRWILEQFEYSSVEVVYPGRLNAGHLSDDFDVIIFPSGALGSAFAEPFAGAEEPGADEEGPGGGFRGRDPDAETIPEEYRDRLGRLTPAATMPSLQEFLGDGGTIVTVGGSTDLGRGLGLPIEDHLVERGDDGEMRSVRREEYYVPGSILEVALDETAPVTTGVGSPLMVSFENSPVFDITGGSGDSSTGLLVRPIAWFDSAEPLRSGWAWGQERLEGGVTMAQAEIGDGTLYMFGPLITRRAQPHASFKLLFNAIALSNAEDRRP